MAQAYSNSKYRRTVSTRRRKGAGGRLAFIALLGAGAFVLGFILLWSLGSLMVGGKGFPGGSDSKDSAASLALAVQSDYKIEPLVDLLAFRDLSYVPVKGVYMTGYSAGSSTAVDRLVGLADRTEINAFVINVKDDDGYVTYETDAPLAQELGASRKIIEDIDGLLATLGEHNIIPIARVVCFKDDILPKSRPDLAVQDKRTEGELWTDNSKYHHTYLNPYSHEVWEYLVEVAEDAARRGFREIQFDYVRFPSDGDVKYAMYPGEYCSKDDAIAGFLAYAKPRLEKLGVWISADVFGQVVAHQTTGIGQQLEKMCQNLDLICTMVYPSHYSDNSYGIPYPNGEPGKLLSEFMQDVMERFPGTGVQSRPWLQDWSGQSIYGGAWVDYTPALVRAQIDAVEELGFNEWILWNAKNVYTEEALHSEGG